MYNNNPYGLAKGIKTNSCACIPSLYVQRGAPMRIQRLVNELKVKNVSGVIIRICSHKCGLGACQKCQSIFANIVASKL